MFVRAGGAEKESATAPRRRYCLAGVGCNLSVFRRPKAEGLVIFCEDAAQRCEAGREENDYLVMQAEVAGQVAGSGVVPAVWKPV